MKSPALYNYRMNHNGRRRMLAAGSWADQYDMPHETVAVLVPLSGRAWAWPKFAEWLDKQTWPHNQVELRLLDTSQDDTFGATVRAWVAQCDYPHITYMRAAVGAPGLADRPRMGSAETAKEVNRTMLRIWSRLAAGLTTAFAVTLEDDILPPPDALSRLLINIDGNTDAVCARYKSRYHGTPLPASLYRGVGVEPVGYAAFGCTAWRTDVLQSRMTAVGGWYDHHVARGRRILCDWSLQVEHRNAPEMECAK